MGTFFTEVQIASPGSPDRRETVKLLVDSGSMYTLEGFGFGIDPVQRRLIPSTVYGASAAPIAT